jgi:hypothetical protein
MPRRDYEDDDRPSRRRYRDEDDDRPRPRSRRRYEDEEDDYDDRPRRRKSGGSNSLPLILIGLGAAFVVLLLVGFVGYFFLRPARPAQQAPPPQWAGMPPPPVNPMPMVPPAGPGGPPTAPLIPPGLMPVEPGKQVAISNLRVQRGIGGRSELVFDYSFAAGRPIGLYSAVVTEPGGQSATADLHFLDQQGTISLSSFGPFGGNFRSGTKVYISTHAIGIRNVPPPISNTLTLP